jgi:SAM-dependent methyltransferase
VTPEQAFFDASTLPAAQDVLDVGCGDRKRVPWAVGIDRIKTSATDVVHDLDTYPWPFPDNRFDLILASHVVEHLADVLRLCEELHRIARPGALIKIATPHFTSPDAFVDPTHRHQFGYRSFEFVAKPDDAHLPPLQQRLNALFGMEATVAGWYTEPRFEIVERRITFRKPHRLLGFDRLAHHAPLIYEYFLGALAPARDIQVTLRVRKDR